MSTYLDELKGRLKQGVGNLTGDESMKREGQAEATKAKVERTAEDAVGTAQDAVDKTMGSMEETVGNMTDEHDAELEGQARQSEGDIKPGG